MKRRTRSGAVFGRAWYFCRRALGVLLDVRFVLFLAWKVGHAIAGARTEYLSRRRTRASGVLRLGAGSTIPADAVIEVGPPDAGERSITLGRRVYVGHRVQLGVAGGNAIEIGDDSSIQDNTVILGDVTIGRHCLLSCNIYISSGNHYCRLFPTWLIRDQDAQALGTPEGRAEHSRPVVIEDDVWIGWGVFIRQGVYIGRGAVLGAYTVVTRDVPPYSIQAGAPNREVGRRLKFAPPGSLCAAEEAHRPYFYRGFLLQQAALALSVPRGVVFATRHARLLVGRHPFRVLELGGILPAGVARIELRVSCNGRLLGDTVLRGSTWSTAVVVDPGLDVLALPAARPVLGAWFELELQVTGQSRVAGASEPEWWAEDALFGLSEVRLRPKNPVEESPCPPSDTHEPGPDGRRSPE